MTAARRWGRPGQSTARPALFIVTGVGVLAAGLLCALRHLVAAGLAQIGDAVLGLRQRNPGMIVAPAIMGCLYLVSARILRRHDTRR